MESAPEKDSYWQDFGTSLARLHKHSADHFGLDHDNYIGSLEQFNDPHENWIEFFISQRLEIQVKMARDQGLMDTNSARRFEKLYHSLSDFFPEEKPSLIHGDLWSGNYMTNSQGKACIIDPAVYYGHRLMDIGMSKLFGGFAPAFYESYHSEFPMENNWRQAIEVANLYPLMVHVNLFGAGYLGGVMDVLKRV
ncbi:MAG: fructosamine kinase family protein [Bacteroidales bacterium]